MHTVDPSCALLVADHIAVCSNGSIVLRDVDFVLTEKSCICISGDANSGKSLLLQTLAGKSAPVVEGQLIYRQQPLLAEHAPPLVKLTPGMLMASAFDALLENVRMSSNRHRSEWGEWLCDRLLHWGFPELRQFLDLPVLHLSTLHQRVVAIAREALAQPDVLLIDDLTKGLDEYDRFVLLDFVRTLCAEMAVVIVLNHPKDASLLDAHHIVLDEGRMVQAGTETSNWSAFDDLFIADDLSVSELDHQRHREPVDTNTNVDLWAEMLDTLEPHQGVFVDTEPSLADGDFVPASCGPRGFYWVIEGVLAGSPLPGLFQSIKHDFQAIRRCQVNTIISMSQAPLDNDELYAHGLSSLWLGQEPSLGQLRMLAVTIERAVASGQVMLVHCTSGNRRTGLVLCAYLIHTGKSVTEAVEHVQAANPSFFVPEQYRSLLHELARGSTFSPLAA